MAVGERRADAYSARTRPETELTRRKPIEFSADGFPVRHNRDEGDKPAWRQAAENATRRATVPLRTTSPHFSPIDTM